MTYVYCNTVFSVCTPPTILEMMEAGRAIVSSFPKQTVQERPLILCIEDSPTYLVLRKKVLEREGYEVLGVTSTKEALKALRDFPVCATIADHMLQGTTGVELAREMKKVKPNVPIILFSGTVPQSLNAVDVYVNKGEPTATFLGIVRAVVQRYRS